MSHSAPFCPAPSANGNSVIDIDYYSNPVLARNSVAQLLQRSGLMGFSNLVWVSGDWRSLASPFCRLDRENPISLTCEPEYIEQESDNAKIAAAYVGPDSIAIEVTSVCDLQMHSGAPGKIHHNGGTAHQQWMAFDAFRGGATLQQISPDMILACNGDYCAVFIAPGIIQASNGNGWSLQVRKGVTFLGAGVAFRNHELAEQRARSAYKALQKNKGIGPIRQRLQSEWNEIFQRFPWPVNLDLATRKLGYNAAWCIFSNLAAPEGYLKRPAIIGAKIQYPGVFPWDSAFAAVALKEADPQLARDQIELYTDVLRESEDGRVGEMTALHSGGGVQFPLFAWSAWKIHQAHPDVGFLERIYEPLAKHASWWLRPEGAPDGIPYYERVVCLDDSPRFDAFAGEGRMALREPVYGADLITICALDHLYLARIAETLGRADDASYHRLVAGRLTAFVEEDLYDNSLQRYIDIGAESGTRSSVNTPLNHFPGILSPSPERQKLAAEALSPAGPFWGKFGLTTVSPEESSFDPCRIWRGPIWFSVNYLCAEACFQMGYPEIADAIANSTTEIIRANAPLPNGIMEYFNYLTGEGSGAHHIATMSAAPFISFLLGHHREVSAADRGFPVFPVSAETRTPVFV